MEVEGREVEPAGEMKKEGEERRENEWGWGIFYY